METDDRVTGTLDDLIVAALREDPAGMLRAGWLAHAIHELRRSRMGAGLTQAEVADRMGTKQSDIARLERNGAGISLKRYIDYALAVGVVPDTIVLRPLAEATEHALQRRGATS